MTDKTLNQLTRSLREIESSVCDLTVILDELDPTDKLEGPLGTAIFNLNCEVYNWQNKIKKILDNLKIN